MKLKRILKIIGGVIVFFTLPSLLFFGFLYFKYNEDLPVGEQGAAADVLATRMLNILNHDAYKATDYLEWTFKNRHHYKWYKSENRCEVYWKNYSVDLFLNDTSESKAYHGETLLNGEQATETIQKATDYFNNDSFWLVAPYKVFDEGVERRIVTTKDNKQALLITYTSGGSTPGDSYLWHFDDNGKPTHYQMWVSILPINGLEASWSDWITTESGAQLPTFHKLLFLGLEMGEVKGKTIKRELKDDDIIDIDVTFIQKTTNFPIRMDCEYFTKESIPKKDIYYVDKYDRFYKNIREQRFLKKLNLELKKLSKPDSLPNPFDARISMIVNYNNKTVDSLCFSENFGFVSLNGNRMKDSPKLHDMIKSEIKYEYTFRTKEEVLGLVETIN